MEMTDGDALELQKEEEVESWGICKKDKEEKIWKCLTKEEKEEKGWNILKEHQEEEE